MSDYKVTELNEILATSVAADDVALLVDVSASEDKKITIEELSKAVGANLPPDSLDGDIIIDGTIDGDKILDGSITAGKLAPDSVDRTHIIAEEVSGSETQRGKVHIEPGSIGAADIADGSITPDKLVNPGGPLLITDNEVDPNANIQVSKLEPAPPITTFSPDPPQASTLETSRSAHSSPSTSPSPPTSSLERSASPSAAV